jgi:predicted transport protein
VRVAADDAPAKDYNAAKKSQTMSILTLFRTNGGAVSKIDGHSVALERSLQTLIERNLETFVGVRFLCAEYSTGKTHAGRIDTLGIDEDGCPCILEYKRSTNENVINQGLFYLDWLMDHRGEFELLVMKTLGPESAGKIDWTGPRLICIAGDFTKYDQHAVQQINRNIQLIRYMRFGEELLLLELVNSVQAVDGDAFPATEGISKTSGMPRSSSKDKTVDECLAASSQKLLDLYELLRSTLVSFGDDVVEKRLKLYVAFKRIKNFVCVEVLPNQEKLRTFLRLNPDKVELDPTFMRDVRQIGHWGTGELEITITTPEDVERNAVAAQGLRVVVMNVLKCEKDLLNTWRLWDAAEPPFVLQDDEPVLRQVKGKVTQTWDEAHTAHDFGLPGDRRLHLGLLPHPFCGDVANASIYVLMLNPGVGFQDYYGEYHVPDYRSAVVATLRQEFQPDVLPFMYLDPKFAWHGGFAWWHGKLAGVIKHLCNHWQTSFAEARARLARCLASIELVPYHSESFGNARGIAKRLPSAQLAARFVREFVLPKVRDGKGIVIVTRKVRAWELPDGPGIIKYTAGQSRGAHLGLNSPGGAAIIKRFLRFEG